MKQSSLMSFVESTINILVGFGIACIAQAIFLPLLGVPIPWTANFIFAGIMTVISIARSFALRRLFEALHIRRPMSPFMQAVVAERYRQIEEEGWSLEHDDEHEPGEMARASAAYALQFWVQVTDAKVAAAIGHPEPTIPRKIWPWSFSWWKPDEWPRRNAVKSGALMIAEGEKFDRARKSKCRDDRAAA